MANTAPDVTRPKTVYRNTVPPLRRMRMEREMSQGDLARRSGISQQVISHYESGRNAIGINNLAKLARALGCAPSDLDPRFALPDDGKSRGAPQPAPALPPSGNIAQQTRQIDDNILLYIVDSWSKMPAQTKMKLIGVINQVGAGD